MSQAGQVTSRRVTRRSRIDEPQPTLEEIEARIVDPDDPSIQSNSETNDAQPTPEEIAAAAAAKKKADDARIASAEARAKAAEEDAARARAASNQTSITALERQEQAIKGAVTSAEAARSAAAAKYKAARDANDVDAETAANTELADAAAQLHMAKATAANFEQWKQQNADKLRQMRQPVQQRQVQNDGPSPEARRWIGTHPAYNSDANYRAEALSAHELALADLGEEKEGTPEYVAYIDSHMEKVFGKGHGQIDHGRKANTMVNDRQNINRNTSTAAPRGEGANQRRSGPIQRGGGEEIEYEHTDGSRLRLVRGVDNAGKPYETVVGTIPAEWREYARISGMKDIPYAVEQIKIADSMNNGGPEAGLAYQRDGVYR